MICRARSETLWFSPRVLHMMERFMHGELRRPQSFYGEPVVSSHEHPRCVRLTPSTGESHFLWLSNKTIHNRPVYKGTSLGKFSLIMHTDPRRYSALLGFTRGVDSRRYSALLGGVNPRDPFCEFPGFLSIILTNPLV